MSGVRVRRHTDGRVAVCTELADGPYRWLVWPPYGRLTDEHVTGEGWCELLVAELPKPDPALLGEIADDKWGDLETLRADALKMLAAVAACERCRAGVKS